MVVKILLVEDESIEALDIKSTLESFNYEVPYVASNGEEAVKKALEIKPDLILMDIILKGDIDGVEAASKVKDLNIPIIYLTAHSEESTIERAKLTEPYGYLIKPFNAIELRYVIELALYKNKMERELKDSEKKYHSIVENVLDAYFRGDKEGQIIMASPSAAKMYRFQSPEEMIGISAISLYKNPEDREKMLGDLKKKGKVLNMEGEGLRNDGTSFWVSMNVQYIYDDEGDIQGTEAFIRDITATKKAEKELEKRETYYRTIFEHTGTATVIIGEDTTISLANAEFEKLSGYCREEIQGKKSWTDFVVKEDVGKMNQYHHLRRNDPSVAPIIYDFRFKNRQGDIKNIHLDVDIIPGTNESVASLLDFTEHKKALEEIKKLYKLEHEARADAEAAKKEIYTILNRVSDSFVALDNNWIYTYVNKKGAENFDKTPEEMIGQHIWTMFPEGIDQPFYKAYYHAMKEQKYIHLEEYYAPYGRWFRNDIYPSEDGITIFFKDITEEKEAEEELQKSEEKYRALFDNAEDGILLMNGDHFIDCNQKALEIYGASREQLIGNTPIKFSPEIQPDGKISKNRGREFIKNALEGRPQHFQWEHIRSDGTPFYTEVTLNRLKIGHEYLLMAVVRDITRRKKTEYDLNESLQENEIISHMVMQLVGAANTSEIYTITGKAVKELLPHSSVIVTGISPDGENVRIMNIFGLDSLNKLIKILRKDPYKMEFPVKEITTEDLKKHRSEKLTEYEDGIYDLTMGKIPRPVSKMIEKVFHIGEIHSIRFFFETKHYGGVSIFLREGQPMEHKEAVETVVHQASIAIRRSLAEESIKNSLTEKEVLIREIHHRVNNNMQIISSLLNLQTDDVQETETKNILRDNQSRIRSMAIIHENLYLSSDISHINFKDYIENLVSDTLYTFGVEISSININLNIEEFELNMETAIPLGLIINELLTNSIKFAFPENNKGTINIKIKRKNDIIKLITSDNGIGLPEEIDFTKTHTLGLKLVKYLVRQIDGKIELDRDHGTKFTITFKELPYKERITI